MKVFPLVALQTTGLRHLYNALGMKLGIGFLDLVRSCRSKPRAGRVTRKRQQVLCGTNRLKLLKVQCARFWEPRRGPRIVLLPESLDASPTRAATEGATNEAPATM